MPERRRAGAGQKAGLSRRRLLLTGLAASALGTTFAGPAAAALTNQPFRDGATLLVAGPVGGRLDQISAHLAGALLPGLPSGTMINRLARGGPDGVAGANEFAARAAPDGLTALLLPGVAVIDWLAGDSRCHFEANHFVPVLGGLTSRVLLGRSGVDLTTLTRPLRIAAARPVGPDLPALLGIDMLGVRPEPVFGLEGVAARAALARGEVDAVQVQGADIAETRLALANIAVPLFSLGMVGADGRLTADPALPDVPHWPALYEQMRGTPPAGPIYAAWRSASAAAILDFALLLPALTPPAMVSLWRGAAGQLVADPIWQQSAKIEATRILAGPETMICLGNLASTPPALADLRRWLAERLDWRPG